MYIHICLLCIHRCSYVEKHDNSCKIEVAYFLIESIN